MSWRAATGPWLSGVSYKYTSAAQTIHMLTITGGPELTADTLLCPSCGESRTYGQAKTLRDHYRVKHLKWNPGMNPKKWDKRYQAMWLKLDVLLGSGCLTYRWKMENGQMMTPSPSFATSASSRMARQWPGLVPRHWRYQTQITAL